jgi:exosortase
MSHTSRTWTRAEQLALALTGGAVLALFFALPYAGGYGSFRKTIARHLWERWFDGQSTVWQYGVLVPIAIAVLVWKRRERFLNLEARPSWWGLPLILFALFSYYVGFKSYQFYFGYLAIQMFIGGAVLFVLGREHLRVQLYPWAIVSFLWPIVYLEERIAFPLRLLSTKGVMLLAKLCHLPIRTEGTSIYSASANEDVGKWMTLEIDGPCSGMNTLFALMFVAALYSYFAQRSAWRRVLLFACSIPLAFLGNVVRLGLLIGGCAVLGQDIAVGNADNHMTTYHLLAGLVVFPVLVLGLQWISAQMTRRLGRR